MQASPDRAYGATGAVDLEVRGEQAKHRGWGAIFEYIDIFSAFPKVVYPAKGPPQEKH